MADGVRQAVAGAEIEQCPISDGGEGFTECIALANEHQMVESVCTDPLGRQMTARWCLLGTHSQADTAIIEMASASGLILLSQNERDATQTSTFGTGQLIDSAIQAGAKQIILGIGGSATNDAGCGMAQALGAKFFDQQDRLITEPITGGLLNQIARIDVSVLCEKLQGIDIVVACDVTNPLTGPNGAAHVYAPQKGATPEQVEQLDTGLRHIAELWRNQFDAEVEQTPGSGAAGGLGGGLLAFCGAELRSGLDIVLEYVRFDQRVKDCDLCLSGEGQLDGQSLSGKAVLGLAKAAAKHNVPTVAFVGKLGKDYEKAIAAGLKDAIEVGPGLPPAQSMSRAAELLKEAVFRLLR